VTPEDHERNNLGNQGSEREECSEFPGECNSEINHDQGKKERKSKKNRPGLLVARKTGC